MKKTFSSNGEPEKKLTQNIFFFKGFDRNNSLLQFVFFHARSSLTIGNNPSLRSHDLLTIVLNCHSLHSLHLYRVTDLVDDDIQLMLLRLKDRLRELILDRVFELNESAYEVSGHIEY